MKPTEHFLWGSESPCGYDKSMLGSQMASGKFLVLLQKLRSLFWDSHLVQKGGTIEDPAGRLECPQNVLSHGTAPQTRLCLKCQL